MKALCFFLLFIPTWVGAQHIDSVRIGSGGGFSGQTIFYVMSHKKVTKTITLPGSLQKVSPAEKITCAQFHQLKKGAQSIWKSSTGWDHPSNMTKWVEVWSKGQVQKYTWGDPSFSPPSLLTDYYQRFLDILKTVSFY